MKLIHNAQAGTLESSDVMIVIKTVADGTGRDIQLDSNVSDQFSDLIYADIYAVLDAFEIKDVKMLVTDKGALSPVIKARLETAIKRSLGIQEGTLI